VYPDSGKVMVRGLRAVGFLEKTPYLQGEPETPKIFELAKRAPADGSPVLTSSDEHEP
jgi:hypothetical protein